jgi:hypothetical protein
MASAVKEARIVLYIMGISALFLQAVYPQLLHRIRRELR